MRRRLDHLVCTDCGSEDVSSSATYNVTWDFDTQGWLQDTSNGDYDHPNYCRDCQDECGVEWQPTIQFCLFADGDYNTIYEETDYDE